MKVGIIILCRYNSSRLPGKILMEIAGYPILHHIVTRLKKIFPSENIIVATSVESTDDIISDFCANNQINCFRGSLDNVAERFLGCALEYDFDFVFRINGDNIFIDIELVESMLEKIKAGDILFISNVDKRSYPKGMSIEGVDVLLYKESLSKFSAYDREHVMPYFYNNAHNFNHLYMYNTIYPELAGIQLAIDTKEDFENASYIVNLIGLPEVDFRLVDIAQILIKNRNEKSI